MRLTLIISFVVILLTSCNQGAENSSDNSKKLDEIMNKLAAANYRKAKVIEAVNAGTYTYVKLDDQGKVFWAAITARQVEIGETYVYIEGMMMKDFESKQLETTFDSVMFIQDFRDPNDVQEPNVEKPNPHDHNKIPMQGGINVEPAKNGKTIAEIFSNKNSLNGSKVIVRGQVVKISKNIMKRNWIHIQDGTGNESNYDLTVITALPLDFGVGDIITFEGTLNVDKDFGAGYRYDAILEDVIWHQTSSF